MIPFVVGFEVLWLNPYIVAIAVAACLGFAAKIFIAATRGAPRSSGRGAWLGLALIAWLIGGLAVSPWGPEADPIAANILPAMIRIIIAVLVVWLSPDAVLMRKAFLRRPSRAVLATALLVYVALLPLIFHLASRQDPDSMQDQARRLLETSDLRVRVAMAFSLVVATPLFEELIYRGLLMHAIAAHLPVGFAIGLTTVSFTLVHQPAELWPAVFVLGLVLAFIARRSGSLWPAVLVHAVHNGLTFTIYVMRGSS